MVAVQNFRCLTASPKTYLCDITADGAEVVFRSRWLQGSFLSLSLSHTLYSAAEEKASIVLLNKQER